MPFGPLTVRSPETGTPPAQDAPNGPGFMPRRPRLCGLPVLPAPATERSGRAPCLESRKRDRISYPLSFIAEGGVSSAPPPDLVADAIRHALFNDNPKEHYLVVSNPFEATRYHSLVVAPDKVPEVLEVTARTEAGEIMGLRHRETLCAGVQFHPESVLTQAGEGLMANFVRQVDRFWEGQAT